MEPKIKWLLYLAGVLIISSACNLFSLATNPVEEAVSEVEDLVEEVDIQEVEQMLDTLATDLPVKIEELEDTVDLDQLSGLEATAEAIGDEFTFGEPPPDIPIVEGHTEILLKSKDIVTYKTTLDFDEVLRFYKEQMPANDWEAKQDETVIEGKSAVLTFEKPGRQAILTLSVDPNDKNTYVMITILAKE